jgi:hypothetical protein
MTPDIYHIKKYYCVVLVAMIVLASAGCDSLLQQCDNGPDNAIRTLGGTGAVLTLKDNEDYDNPTYSLIIALPDPYLRWKTDSGDFGIHSLTCLGIYWNATFGDNWQSVVIWAGTSTPVCGEIRSLRVLAGVVLAELKLKRADGTALAAAASLVLALGRECPAGACSGKFIYKTCFAPYVSFDNATNYASLSAVDLNFATMSGTFFRANLSGASLNNATMTGADLREAELDKAALCSADLSGAILRQATLDGAALYAANLTGADLFEATLNNTVLSYADFTGADLTGVELSGARVYQTIAPDGVTVDNATALLLHSLIY